MRALRFLNLGILAAMVASSAVLYAQDDKQQEEKPRQEEPKRQQEPNRQDQARPESRQDETRSPRQDEARPDRRGQQDQQRSEQQQRQEEAQPRGDMRPRQQEPNRQEQDPPEAGRQEQRRQEGGQQEAGRGDDRDRARGNRGRIPEERFRAEFGREHHFAVHHPQVVEGRPQFQYGGYTFVLVDPWPPAWAYDDDDCYIDYIDGYYFLFNVRHPEERLALELVM